MSITPWIKKLYQAWWALLLSPMRLIAIQNEIKDLKHCLSVIYQHLEAQEHLLASLRNKSLNLVDKKMIKNLSYQQTQHAPQVSVIVTCYKYAKYLEECIASVAGQTLSSFEIILVNDCSPDNTFEIAEKILHKYSSIPILLMNNETNLGLAHSRNLAIEHSRAPFFFILDADNTIEPVCLEKHLEMIQQENVAFCYSYKKNFGEQVLEEIITPPPYDFELLKYDNYIDAMAMVRKSAWKKVQGYQSQTKGWEDYELWLNLGKHGLHGKLITEHLINYRKHLGSMIDITHTFHLSYNKNILNKLHPELNLKIRS